jgi:GntR family transcriptional regulator/MocR family aminotransferase
MIDKLADADAVLLTPAHQFPLGAALASQRRGGVVAWADATAGLIIEDDYDGEFRYDRQPVGAVQALAPERVAYAGTASKALAPGLRLGWLALPAARQRRRRRQGSHGPQHQQPRPAHPR